MLRSCFVKCHYVVTEKLRINIALYLISHSHRFQLPLLDLIEDPLWLVTSAVVGNVRTNW